VPEYLATLYNTQAVIGQFHAARPERAATKAFTKHVQQTKKQGSECTNDALLICIQVTSRKTHVVYEVQYKTVQDSFLGTITRPFAMLANADHNLASSTTRLAPPARPAQEASDYLDNTHLIEANNTTLLNNETP